MAEEACQFEHRDLHWGNLLIQRGVEPAAAYRLRGVDIAAQTEGVRWVCGWVGGHGWVGVGTRGDTVLVQRGPSPVCHRPHSSHLHPPACTPHAPV